jgi:hypothetical protein
MTRNQRILRGRQSFLKASTSKATRIAGKSFVDFVAFNLNNFNERLDQAVASGVNGAKRIASIACSRIGQEEKSVQLET